MKVPILFFLLHELSLYSASPYPVQRRLSVQKIGGYQPITHVLDLAAIDKDNELIEKLLSEGNFDNAAVVYEKGAFSRSYALIHLSGTTLPGDIQANTVVTGTAINGESITGTIFEPHSRSKKSLHVYYEGPNGIGSCFVGGSPEPVLEGCFKQSGKIMFDEYEDIPIPYHYNFSTENRNEHTLATFSTNAIHKMRPCSKCNLYTEYSRYSQFYGKTDYAHQWILAAMHGNRTVFDSSTADFQNLSVEARAAAVNKALVTMHLMVYIIRELEESVNQCKSKCPLEGCTDLGVHAIDSAAAYYFGSLDDDKEGSGRLMQHVADLECKEFKTCGSSGDSIKGTSKANHEVLQELQIMQQNITQRACTEGRSRKDRIVKWMKVPLIQGTLRYAYLRYKSQATSVDIATGAIYAASIVPLVSGCSYTDAEIINNNMETTARTTDFAAVKEAFERQYTCLAIKCSDIGGYWDHSSKAYFDGAEMCTFDVVAEESAPEEKKTVRWGIIASLAAMLVITLYLYQRRKKAKAKQRKNKARESDIDFSDSSDDSDDDFRIT